MKKISRFVLMMTMLLTGAVFFAGCSSSSDDDDGSPDTPSIKIINVGVSFDFTMTFNGSRTHSYFNQGGTEDKITVKRNKDTYRVEVYSNNYGELSISFNFTLKNGKFGKITDLKAYNRYEDSFMTFEATDIEFRSDNGYQAIWVGKDDNGMKVSNLEYSHEYGAGNGYIVDPYNELVVDIDYDTD